MPVEYASGIRPTFNLWTDVFYRIEFPNLLVVMSGGSGPGAGCEVTSHNKHGRTVNAPRREVRGRFSEHRFSAEQCRLVRVAYGRIFHADTTRASTSYLLLLYMCVYVPSTPHVFLLYNYSRKSEKLDPETRLTFLD